MSRRPARVTQADVARALRAAKQEGAAGVDVLPDGTIRVLLVSPETASRESEGRVDRGAEIVL
ncbi:MAG: hypothetical protein WB495_07585 [Xanthobacteraceae bacterium]